MAEKSDQAEAKKPGIGADGLRRLRRLVHRQLIDTIDMDDANVLTDQGVVKERIGWLVEDIEEARGVEVTEEERARIEKEILEELGGVGPLAPLMMDPEISDILVNGPDEVWVDRFGLLQKTDVHFDDAGHLKRILDRMVSTQGRHLDTSSPMVDVRMNDGSRLHAVIPPLCAKGPIVSIRRFRVKPFGMDEMVETGFITRPMLKLLELAVVARLNIVISGGAAAGKTTLLNMISRFIPETERVVTIEETAELRLEHPHVIPLESRPSNVEGRGGIGLTELVRNSLRMRADRIIVGEVRGVEVFDMLQAMNIGHDGSLSTVHANSPNDVLRRLETLVLMGDTSLPRAAIREMIGAAIQVNVHLVRYRDGSRRVVSISEVIRTDDKLEMHDLYRFQAEGVSVNGHLNGKHVATGESIQFLKQIKQKGYDVKQILGKQAQGEDDTEAAGDESA